jgi:hypothetical protein
LATCCVIVEAPCLEPVWTLVIDGATEAHQVDAGMLVEILVLSREKRSLDAVRHGLDRQVKPAFAREFAHQRAVRGMHAGRHRRLVVGEHFVVRQVLRQMANVEGRAPRDEQSHRRGDAEEIAD